MAEGGVGVSARFTRSCGGGGVETYSNLKKRLFVEKGSRRRLPLPSAAVIISFIAVGVGLVLVLGLGLRVGPWGGRRGVVRRRPISSGGGGDRLQRRPRVRGIGILGRRAGGILRQRGVLCGGHGGRRGTCVSAGGHATSVGSLGLGGGRRLSHRHRHAGSHRHRHRRRRRHAESLVASPESSRLRPEQQPRQ